MTMPAILLDVDGVLNPDLKCKPPWCPCHPSWLRRHAHVDGVKCRLYLNPEHGRSLNSLASETDSHLLWATTWNHDANLWIGPAIGLPVLPVVPIPQIPRGEDYSLWKARQVARWADRPFVWFDDGPGIKAEMDQLTSEPHLIVTTDEHVGLTGDHIQEARDWLRRLP